MANDSSLKLLASWFSLVLAAHSPNQPKQLQNVQQWQSNWKLKTKSLDCWCKKVCGVAAEDGCDESFHGGIKCHSTRKSGLTMLGNIGFCKTDSVVDIILNAETCWNCCYHSDKQKNENCTFHVNKNAKTKPTKLRAAQALFQMAARQSWKDISMFKCNILVLRQTAIFLSTTRRGPTQSPN